VTERVTDVNVNALSRTYFILSRRMSGLLPIVKTGVNSQTYSAYVHINILVCWSSVIFILVAYFFSLFSLGVLPSRDGEIVFHNVVCPYPLALLFVCFYFKTINISLICNYTTGRFNNSLMQVSECLMAAMSR